MIKVDSLSVKIEGKEIINDISFSAQSGENISIIGPNGAGKTTLLKAMAGLIDFSGQIKIGGHDSKEISNIEMGSKLSFIPQGSDIDGGFTVRSFVELSRYPYRKPWEKMSKYDLQLVEDAMYLTNCSEFADREIGSLSGGEKQRILIAGAIAQDCPVILLDEPLTYLDPAQRDKITKLIGIVSKKENRLVITVTHEINEAISLSSKILVLSQGRLVFNDTSEKLINSDVLNEVFKTDFIKITNPFTGKVMCFPGEPK